MDRLSRALFRDLLPVEQGVLSLLFSSCRSHFRNQTLQNSLLVSLF